MKILYVVSNINTASKGNGGHYYSMLATAEALGVSNDVVVLNIGTEKSIALKDATPPVVNILQPRLNTWKLLKELNIFLKKSNFEVIHSFDDLAFFYLRIAAARRKIPVVLTKCGGVNPKYFPFCKTLVTFSEENRNFFRSQRKFLKANIHLIPNRVSPFKQDVERIKTLSEKHQLASFDVVFTRISRIGLTYQKTLKQLIHLAASCSLEGKNTCVLVIGTVVDNQVLRELKECAKDICIRIEDDPYYTRNAKELIDVGDVVVGTGRSFMEAALQKKIMFAPLKENDFPVLVDDKNFSRLFKTNFSERGNVDNFDPDLQMDFLKNLLVKRSVRESFSENMYDLFKGNFDIREKVKLYEKIYSQEFSCSSPKFIDVFLHYLFIQRRFFISKKIRNR